MFSGVEQVMICLHPIVSSPYICGKEIFISERACVRACVIMSLYQPCYLLIALHMIWELLKERSFMQGRQLILLSCHLFIDVHSVDSVTLYVSNFPEKSTVQNFEYSKKQLCMRTVKLPND